MASSGSILKMSEETFEYICTSCAEDDIIKEALKYCVECQKYCCKDCLTYHRRFAALKGHSFLDNTSVKPKGQPKSLPAFPTKQCTKHVGMILYMFCKNHDTVCCHVCAGEDHRSCNDIVSISDNIDQLYNMIGTSQARSELSNTLDTINQRLTNNQTLLQQLQDSKATAIKAVSDSRIELEKWIKKLEEASINEIKDEYKKLEAEIVEERKRYEEFIDELNDLKQLFIQASENIAQLFICTKLAEKKCTTLNDEMRKERFDHAEVEFIPSEELTSSIKKMKHLGEASAISSKICCLYKATKICDMNVRLKEDTSQYKCIIHGSCVVDDTVLFTDFLNHKLKRFDVSSSSLVDWCEVPSTPYGVCRVGEKELAVACKKVVQLVSMKDDKLSLLRAIKMKHQSYGIAHNNDKLYITDNNKTLYMYDMSGNLLKTVTKNINGEPLFGSNYHITFNEKNDILFVSDIYKGLVCFNAQCDYIETVSDLGVSPTGVCVDGHDNIIVASNGSKAIVPYVRDGQKYDRIVKQTQDKPWCVCVHHGLRKMFVGCYDSDTVEVYTLI